MDSKVLEVKYLVNTTVYYEIKHLSLAQSNQPVVYHCVLATNLAGGLGGAQPPGNLTGWNPPLRTMQPDPYILTDTDKESEADKHLSLPILTNLYELTNSTEVEDTESADISDLSSNNDLAGTDEQSGSDQLPNRL
ncbi:unnamed protein product [Penicillium bialowiezense]